MKTAKVGGLEAETAQDGTMQCLRLASLFAAAFSAGFASAETYIAQIYSVPGGADSFEVLGAGNNAMITGILKTGSQEQAVYQTLTGHQSMHPAGWATSAISDSVGSTYHAGYGVNGSSQLRALFWLGGGTGVNLHPAGPYTTSQAFGIGGQIQVGTVQMNAPCTDCGQGTAYEHAGSWSRTAASFRRLHALQHRNTVALATDGVRVVGDGQRNSGSQINALLWNNINSNAINLHPAGFDESWGRAVDGNTQGGAAISGNLLRAAIWNGTAASFVNLHPASKFTESYVSSIRGSLQVGTAKPIGNPGRVQAIAWHGVAATWINLHARLPYPYNLYWASSAADIDNQGNIIGSIYHLTTGEERPVVWRRQP